MKDLEDIKKRLAISRDGSVEVVKERGKVIRIDYTDRCSWDWIDHKDFKLIEDEFKNKFELYEA